MTEAEDELTSAAKASSEEFRKRIGRFTGAQPPIAAERAGEMRSPLASPRRLHEFTAVIVIIMGVSGSGKTTIGRLLAARWDCEFLDADDFHPPANIAKMRSGNPLDDDDRAGWLARLRQEIELRLGAEKDAILACSALRNRYRDVLRRPREPVHFVYLRGDFETIGQRLENRADHYMPASLLRSQFAALEEPDDALVVPVELSPAEAVLTITRALDRAAPVSTDAGQTTTSRSLGPREARS